MSIILSEKEAAAETALEEKELRNFWDRYGKLITIAVLLIITCVAVWKFWENRQLTNKIRAAQSYQSLMIAMSQPLEEVKESDVISIAEQLQKQVPDSYYAQYAKFYVAKLAVTRNKLDEAATALQAVLQKPADPVIEELARERLAQVLLAQNKLDEALTLLDAPTPNAFVATRQELKGDVLVAQGKTNEAREAYQTALAAAETNKDLNQVVIKLKLNNLAKEDVQ